MFTVQQQVLGTPTRPQKTAANEPVREIFIDRPAQSVLPHDNSRYPSSQDVRLDASSSCLYFR
jgi:hypothetical protein